VASRKRASAARKPAGVYEPWRNNPSSVTSKQATYPSLVSLPVGSLCVSHSGFRPVVTTLSMTSDHSAWDHSNINSMHERYVMGRTQRARVAELPGQRRSGPEAANASKVPATAKFLPGLGWLRDVKGFYVLPKCQDFGCCRCVLDLPFPMWHAIRNA
jgi:hypothetical protein